MTELVRHRIQRFGWIPDRPDQRDFLFAADPEVTKTLPSSVDLRDKMPPVVDQGQLGSCTANAIGSAVQFERTKQTLPDFAPSRLFIYYGERDIEGTVDQDSGAMIRDGFKVIATLGAPSESDWPYDIARFAQKPPQQAYQDALTDRAVRYLRVPQSLVQMKSCLAAGYPFVVGFTVYESFESSQVAQTGVVPMPAHREQVLGGHAVLVIGYDDASDRWLVRNSWGTGWGQQGYFTIPYRYYTSRSLASDFWTLRLLSGQ